MPEPVVIVDYDVTWVSTFRMLKGQLERSLGGLPVEIEHVGSTSVPGAAAKPIVDIDVVVRSEDDVAKAIRLLAAAGYRHKGDRGVRGREAFDNPQGLPQHHLYVVVSGNSEHRRHLLFRDYLRSHPEDAARYSALKRSLAETFREDRDAYTNSKSAFVEETLRRASAAKH
ncbi:MAG: GrpB family protein [Nitrososphaerota archaeon]|nr:GrpB family protein [Nitrososphaerota archaeon]